MNYCSYLNMQLQQLQQALPQRLPRFYEIFSKFSINTILCFSDLPLKLGIYSVVLVALFGLAVMIYTIYTWAKYGAPSGYATIVVLLSFMFAMLFIIVGIIGEYIAILFAELKDRPVYIVQDTENISSGKETGQE